MSSALQRARARARTPLTLARPPRRTSRSPPTANTAGPYTTALYLSGAQSEGASAFKATAPLGITYGPDYKNAANSAMNVALGSYLSTATLPQLPTGAQPRSVSLWLKCAVPQTSMGRTIFDFSDGTANATTEHLTITGGLAVNSNSPGFAGIVMNGGALQQLQFQYTTTTLAGGTANAFANGVGSNAAFSNPVGIAADLTTGNLYVADQNNYRLRLVLPNGAVSTFVGSDNGGLTGGTAGNLDGVGTNAMLNTFQGVAIDATGTFAIVAEMSNNNVRMVALATRNVTTLAGCKGTGPATGCVSATLDGTGTAAQFASPQFAAIHPTNGNAFILCNVANNVRQVTQLGVVTTIAGSYTGQGGYLDGTGTSALFNAPRGIAMDPTGAFLVLGDSGNCRLRKIVLATGIVTTIAGNGVSCTGSTAVPSIDGIGTNAQLNGPRGVAFDTQGNI